MLFTDFNLPIGIQKAIDDLGFTSPTPIQEKSFNVILSGKDVLGIAQTGTGKTLAYLLPILKQWQFVESENPRVMILVPTRELVVQVLDEVKKLTKYTSIRSLAIYGGTNINTQKKAICEGVDIIVGTPGRIMDLSLDNILRLEDVKKLVIDEFDEILNLGFRTQLTSILSMLKRKKQNVLFSATMTEEVDALLDDYFNFPVEVSLVPSGTPLKNIEQRVICVPNFLTKLNVLHHWISTDETMDKILIFVNSKRLADFVIEFLEEYFPKQFGTIHSNKSQNYRLNTLSAFQNKELTGIITTDIMARGLDISDVSHVVNLQLPEKREQYIHRIGRTGRADKKGIALSILSPKEEEYFLEIEALMNFEVPIEEIPEGVVVEERKLEFEKKRVKAKNTRKKAETEKGKSFHEKKEKNKKVNLGGPGRRNPKKTAPRNREVDRKRTAKRKKRG